MRCPSCSQLRILYGPAPDVWILCCVLLRPAVAVQVGWAWCSLWPGHRHLPSRGALRLATSAALYGLGAARPWQRLPTAGCRCQVPRAERSPPNPPLPCRSGRVSREMMAVPGHYVNLFTRIGLVEAISSLLGFLGAANLPGAPGRAGRTCDPTSCGRPLIDSAIQQRFPAATTSTACGRSVYLALLPTRLPARLCPPQAWCCRCCPRP